MLKVFVAASELSLVVMSRGYPLVAVPRLLIVAASGVGEHRLECSGSVVVVHRLSYLKLCGIFLEQGLNPCPLHWQVDSYPLNHQGSRRVELFPNNHSHNFSVVRVIPSPSRRY